MRTAPGIHLLEPKELDRIRRRAVDGEMFGVAAERWFLLEHIAALDEQLRYLQRGAAVVVLIVGVIAGCTRAR